MASPVPITICDPHFHVWDIVSTPNPNLGVISDAYPKYLMPDYVEDIGTLDIDSAVHVETMVGQVDDGFPLDAVQETSFVLSQLKLPVLAARQAHLVSFVHLGRADAESKILEHRAAAGKVLVGVRMILSYDECDPTLCWPQVAHGRYLKGLDPRFNEGFGLLAKHNLSFDLHINWHQLQDAATFLSAYPDVDVIVDHLGTPRMGLKTDPDVLATWRTGIKALAALPRVYIKASGLEYVRTSWLTDDDANAAVKAMVLEVIDVFGPDRVMFASNFPVDRCLSGANLEDTFTGLYKLVKDLPVDTLHKLFRENARRVYKM